MANHEGFPLFIEGTPKPNSNYGLIFGDEGWGIICSLMQSGVIRVGNGLQDQITLLIPQDIKTTFDALLNYMPISGINVVPLYRMPTSNGKDKATTPDFLVFIHHEKMCYIVEMKLGSQFDTGKSPATKGDLEKVAHHIMLKTEYSTRIKICSFTAINKKEVEQGFKGNFNEDEILLADELCQLLCVRKDEVLAAMVQVQALNLEDLKVLVELKLNGASDKEILDKINELRALHRGQPRLL